MENKVMWSNSGRELRDFQKVKVIARIVETAVMVCMSTHAYSFSDKLFLQQLGGPIGMRFTASLANLVMKMYDKAWCDLLERENIFYHMYLRYMDDVRLFLPSLNRGWSWN